jgi:hypothetical protein
MSAPQSQSLAETEFFTGREGELTALRNLLTMLGDGVGGVVLVEGEQGVGKSALLRHAVGDAAGLGFRLAWGTADEIGQRIPLLLIRECLGGARLVRADALYRGPAAGPLPSGDPVVAEMERLTKWNGLARKPPWCW